MNDFDTLLAQVAREARALAIPISPQVNPHVQVNRRALSRFGCCYQRKDGFLIELAESLLVAPERSCRQTLAHELLHTCPGCRNHGALWRSYAQQMNQAYGYEITRTGTHQALGVPDPRPVRHLVVCRVCGMEFRRTRASALVCHPERYRCRCGGQLIRKY